jgi:hypothetical protein
MVLLFLYLDGDTRRFGRLDLADVIFFSGFETFRKRIGLAGLDFFLILLPEKQVNFIGRD